MTKCDIHYWERYELRTKKSDHFHLDQWGMSPGRVYYVGYLCRKCGEPGYELDLEASSR
jgi:hypothetical protein